MCSLLAKCVCLLSKGKPSNLTSIKSKISKAELVGKWGEREGWKLHLQSIHKENLRNAGIETKIIRKPALIYIFVLKNYKIEMTDDLLRFSIITIN